MRALKQRRWLLTLIDLSGSLQKLGGQVDLKPILRSGGDTSRCRDDPGSVAPALSVVLIFVSIWVPVSLLLQARSLADQDALLIFFFFLVYIVYSSLVLVSLQVCANHTDSRPVRFHILDVLWTLLFGISFPRRQKCQPQFALSSLRRPRGHRADSIHDSVLRSINIKTRVWVAITNRPSGASGASHG